MDCSPPGSSVHGILQARLLERVAISFPILCLWVDTESLFEFPKSYSKFSLAVSFTYGDVSFHVTLSIHCTLSFLPRSHVHKSVLYVYVSIQFSSVHSLSCVRLFATPWTTARHASLSITKSQSPPKPTSIESMMPSNHLTLCRPLLFLPSIFSSIRVFSSESVLHIRWPKYWSFSFSSSPSNGYSGLISFRIDWLDLLAVQGTLKSLLQHHTSKASIVRCSAFFAVQLSHPYMTTGKTIALTRWTFVDKVMSLLFHILSRLVITFLPRSKRLLISWLQSPSAVIFGAPPK